MNTVILKKGKRFLKDYYQKKENNGHTYLMTQWTTSSKKAKLLDRHNDVFNELREYPTFMRNCLLIPKWTEFDSYYLVWEKFYEKSFNICNKENINKNDIIYIRNKWKKIIQRIVNMWGWNEKTAENLFEWGNDGHNWELLWFPHIEDKEPRNPKLEDFRNKNSKQLLLDFLGEIDYCSDRMSLDRLLRCHWEFNFFLKTWLLENNLYINNKNKFIKKPN